MSSLNDVNIENGKVEVELFSKTEAALSDLRSRYQEIPSLDTEEGYNYVKSGLKRLVSLRTGLDAERKRIKTPYLEAGRIIDAEAKRITEELMILEKPMKAAKKEVDDREKRLKEERLARLNQKIEDIRTHVDQARGKPSSDIAEMIQAVDLINTSKDFFELSMDAEKARQDTLERLNQLYSERLSYERAEEDRKKAEAEAAELRKARDIAELLNKLRMIPMDMLGKPSIEIKSKLDSLKNYPPVEADFGTRYGEAADDYNTVLSQLQKMYDQADALARAELQRIHEEKQTLTKEDEKVEEEVAISRPEDKPNSSADEVRKEEEATQEVDPEVRIVINCNQSNSSLILSMLIDKYSADISGDDITGFEVMVKP
jgi:hypothetical protein